MSNVAVAVVTTLIGLVACFYGYPLVRVLFALVGLVIGYQLGVQLVPADQGMLAIIIGVVVGLVCAVLAYPLWGIGVMISGMVLGYSLFYNFGALLHLGSTALIVVGVIGAILMGILFYVAKEPMIMLATALSGASFVVSGLAQLFPELAGPNLTVILAVVALILGLFGFLVQYRMFRGRNTYTRVPAPEPI